LALQESVSYWPGGTGGCNTQNNSKVTCLRVVASDKFSVQKQHPTPGKVLCCRAMGGTKMCRNRLTGEDFMMVGAIVRFKHS